MAGSSWYTLYMYRVNIYIKFKQSPNRLGVGQRVPGGLVPQIFMTFGA